ncbi:MAG: PilZ domain-containing protein [Pseudomonadota bacterium]
MRTADEKDAEGERREEADRRALRRRVLKGVRIAFGNEFCSVDGAMKNISETGALIEIKDGFLVPDDIVVYNELEGYKIPAKVVRRDATRIGIHFAGEKSKIEAVKTQVISMIHHGRHDRDEADEKVEEPVLRRFSPQNRRPVFGKLGKQ